MSSTALKFAQDLQSRQNTKQTVLLVEDYAPNVMVAKTYIEDFGYDCDVADNGQDALEKMKENNYPLVLMDVQMGGISGLEATKLWRQYEKENGLASTNIIGMTAHALVGDREKCIESGMNDYISKPFNPVILEEKMRHFTNA